MHLGDKPAILPRLGVEVEDCGNLPSLVNSSKVPW